MKLIKFLQIKFDIPRRNAFDLIIKGKVYVNRKVEVSVSRILIPGDKVNFEGNELSLNDIQDEKFVFKFDKPKGILSSRRDPFHDKTLYNILPEHIKKIKPLYMIGRLDKESHGLILLTNDGDFANKMSHPSTHVEKEYEVMVDREFSHVEIQQIEQGLIIPDQENLGKTKPIKIKILSQNKYSWILTEGRNRQIRRICKMFGKKVIDLKRIRIGDYKLD